jgi:DNA-binding response OmpR family regulator
LDVAEKALKACRAAISAAAAARTAARQPPVQTLLLSPWPMDIPRKILAVDNEPSVTLSLQFVFTKPRYDLTCVNDGHAALAKLDSDTGPYDVIIVDQKMPKLTGVELVEAIRQRRITSRVIVVSAHLSTEVRQAYEEMGVKVMFGKPFDVQEIRAAIDSPVD